MKRSPLKRRPSPKRTVGQKRFSRPMWGRCMACRAMGWLTRHHAVQEQVVRREGGDPEDLRNGIMLGRHDTCSCHGDHTSHHRKLPLKIMPFSAWQFAVELLGKERAADYFQKMYADE